MAETRERSGHLLYLQRSPTQRRRETHASVAAGMHMLPADMGSWHGQDFRFEPSMTDISPQLFDQVSQVFAGICLFGGWETYKGGRVQSGH